jgi:outer membrane immunogenic protein
MRKLLLATSALAALVMAAPASAADLRVKAQPMPPPPPPFNWSGFYIGINAGYGLANVTIDDQDCNVSCSSQTLTPNGFTVGGTLGYNWQFSSTVLGIEGDWNWINAKKTFNSFDWPSEHHAEIKSFGTLRARAGLAFDRTLVYVTAGVGWLNRNVSLICPIPHECSRFGFEVSKTKAGLAAGAGVEWAIWDNLSAKLEYLFIGVPTANQIPDIKPQGDYDNFNVSSNLHVVRVGLNWRFGGYGGGYGGGRY